MTDLLNMEVGHIATLNRIAYEEAQAKAAADKKQGEDLQDAIEDAM